MNRGYPHPIHWNATKDEPMRIASASQAVFAAILIALRVLGFVKGNFTPVRAPGPKAVPARELLVDLCALVSRASGVRLLWQRTAAVAARVLLAWLLLWVLLFGMPDIFRAPTAQDSWSGWGETAVVVAGAWVQYAWFAPGRDTQRLAFAGDSGLRIARVFYGLALIPFGVAHFNYLKQTAVLVPGGLPFHLAWAYFTGGAFLAAGVAVLTGVFARLAAALSAFQIGMFTLLVGGPIIAAGSKDAFQWSETIVSAAVTANAWLVADSYRGLPWLGVNKR